MSSVVSERQLRLLQVVDEGGESDARVIDLVMSTRHGPSESTVRAELLQLAAEGLVVVDEGRGVGGTWTLTAAGRQVIERDSSG